MKRVSVLLPPISRRGREREDQELDGPRRRRRRGAGPFLSFRDKFAYFWRGPLFSDYDCDVTKEERRLFFPAFYFIARQRRPQEDDCDFANRFPLANPTREAPASFFAIVREKGLKPGMEREREERSEMPMLSNTN